MARFIIHTHPEKKKFDKLFLSFLILAIVLGVFNLASYLWDGKHHYFGDIIIFLFLLCSAIDRLRRRKREHFIDISENDIEWLVSEEGEKQKISWSDIRWIKKERDGNITLFQESSFSKGVSLKDFTEDDTREILQLLEKKVLGRNIRLINFSEVASVPA